MRKHSVDFLKWARENRYLFYYTSNTRGFWRKVKPFPSMTPCNLTETFTDEQLYDLYLQSQGIKTKPLNHV